MKSKIDNSITCDRIFFAEIKFKERKMADVSSKKKITALLLCLFLGGLGIHRFYVGKTGTGILMLLTGGCCGVLWIIDFIMICIGSFTDKQGNFVKA